MNNETWRFERSTMTVRDAANHCLFSNKTFASGGSFDAARLEDSASILALASAAPDLKRALEYALRFMPPSADTSIIHTALDKAVKTR